MSESIAAEQTNYVVEFHTTISLSVVLPADDEETAADDAWKYAEDFLQTITAQGKVRFVDATLDGCGADRVRKQGED